jgi:hypothetical protein
MEVLYPVCCGLDVHKASVTACLRTPGDDLGTVPALRLRTTRGIFMCRG